MLFEGWRNQGSAHAADDADLFKHVGEFHGVPVLVVLSGILVGIISVRLRRE